MTKRPDIDFLRAAFSYDSISGSVFWKPRGNKWFDSRFAFKKAGTKHAAGYLSLSLVQNGRNHIILAHIVIWALYYGRWPTNKIDHIDRCRNNNAISNLRDVTSLENNNNKAQRIGISGIAGVHASGKKWRAIACLDGKRKQFGTFLTISEAEAAYKIGLSRAIQAGQSTTYRSRMAKKTITIKGRVQLMLELFYDEVRGQFYRRYKNGDLCFHPAGHREKGGYVRIMWNGRRFAAHILAWYYVHGIWPNDLIDHIDGNKENNAIANLRDVTGSVNALNRSSVGKKTRGIRIGRNKCEGWEAAVTIKGLRHHIGTFPTFEIAKLAWQNYTDLHCPGAIRGSLLLHVPRGEKTIGVEVVEHVAVQ